MFKFRLRTFISYFGLALLYLVTHLVALTTLPVFADEAIYIRWTQLIITDWHQYLFFPLNDGKTPLFIWSMLPFQVIFSDPLWAGRFFMVMVGLLQVGANALLVKVLGGKTKSQLLSALLTICLPFWYFYHRQSLIDGLLTFFLTLVLICTVKLVQQNSKPKAIFQRLSISEWKWAIGLGVAFGLALLTKIPAILFLPLLPLWILLSPSANKTARLRYLTLVGLATTLGLLLFTTLKISPAFGQLFSRGSDFLYDWQSVVSGKWRETLPNTWAYLDYFVRYTHLFVLLAMVASLFGQYKRRSHLIFWSGLIFCLPMIVLGKVVYARYFLPAMIFITASFSLYLEEIIETQIETAKNLLLKVVWSVMVALIIGNVLASSASFIGAAMTDPTLLPLPTTDRTQYLSEWSSGHGIKEVETYIRQLAQTQTVAVATEGYFGTLPDGLLMYFVAHPDPHVYIEGIGQPVRGIPDFFKNRAATFDQKLLLVNSHRLKMDLAPEQLVLEVCRPDNGPCLQLWNISTLK